MEFILLTSWGDLLGNFLSNPLEFLRDHWYGIIFLLLLLFALSRLNNYMEVNSVNRAINIARAFVGSIMAFVIAPITLLLLINLIAYLKGIPTFSFTFIWDWLKLTGSTFWWIVKSATCFSCDNERMPYAYDINSLIRIAWVVIPVSFIWLRSTSTMFTRLMLLPFIAAILYITYQRKASPTFFDKYIPEQYRNITIDNFLNLNENTTKRLRDIVDNTINNNPEPTTDADRIPPKPSTKNKTRSLNPDKPKKKQTVKPKEPAPNDNFDNLRNNVDTFRENNTRNIVLGLIGLLLLAALLHFYTKFKVLALVFMILGLAGFFVMSPSSFNRPPPPAYVDSNSLLKQFEQTYRRQNGVPSIALTELSFKIQKQLEKEKRTSLPKKYCDAYKDYFYDFCVDRAIYD